MINIYAVIWIFLAHWFADFICQPDRWARNKSKNSCVLAKHVLIYSILMGAAVALMATGLYVALIFCVITFVCHFATDFVTSRMTSKLAAQENWHTFFVVIGFDQFLHALQLLLTFYFLTS